MRCSNCNKTIPDGSMHCPYCYSAQNKSLPDDVPPKEIIPQSNKKSMEKSTFESKVTYKGQTFSPFNYDGLYNTVNSIPTTSYDKLIYDSNPVSASDASDFYCYYSQIEGGIVITKYLGSKSVVNIPSSIDGKPVVKLGTRNVLSKEYGNIGIGVFYECGNVKEITIPDSILSIGGRMFVNCTQLHSITIPDNVIAIDEKAFYDCNVSVTYKGKTFSPEEYKTLFERINS